MRPNVPVEKNERTQFLLHGNKLRWASASDVWAPLAWPRSAFSTPEVNCQGQSFRSLDPPPTRNWTTANGTQDSWALGIVPFIQQIFIDHLCLDQMATNLSFGRAECDHQLCIYETGQHTKHFQVYYALPVLTKPHPVAVAPVPSDR